MSSRSDRFSSDGLAIGELQTVEQQNGSPVVVEEIELSRNQLTVADGDTQPFETTVEPTTDPGRYRLVYMLYRGEPPRNPKLSTAYREVHLWIEITDESTDETG